jgi:hypothetical protein
MNQFVSNVLLPQAISFTQKDKYGKWKVIWCQWPARNRSEITKTNSEKPRHACTKTNLLCQRQLRHSHVKPQMYKEETHSVISKSRFEFQKQIPLYKSWWILQIPAQVYIAFGFLRISAKDTGPLATLRLCDSTLSIVLSSGPRRARWPWIQKLSGKPVMTPTAEILSVGCDAT